MTPPGQKYLADPAWLSGCNGWVAAWDQPTTAADGAAAQIADCGSQAVWNYTQQLSQVLGIYAGESAAAARSNYAITAYTSNFPPVGSVEFQTATNIPLPTASGRFLTSQFDVAAENCPPNAAAPLIQFQLIDSAGTVNDVGGQIDACTVPGGKNIMTEPVGQVPAVPTRVATVSSNGSILFTGSTLGVRILNNAGTGSGNDHAFDNIRIVDVTPSLDKAFSPTTVGVGQASTLTFTITNTSELAAKNGWSFTDTLPSGLTVASPNAAASTCGSPTITAAAGSGTISMVGNLAANQTSCTVSVDVIGSSAGNYVNDASNLAPLVGLNPPATPANLTVIGTDFGDAPASYGTTTTSNTYLAGLMLGTLRDSESAAFVSADASGDDQNNVDDEDAVAGTVNLRPDQGMAVPISVTNTTGAPATAVGWVDFNRDGDFSDPGEQSALTPVPAGATTATLNWASAAGASPGASFVRMRIYPGTPAVPLPTGAATGGEVEDHAVLLQSPAIGLSKTAGAIQDTDGDGRQSAGDQVTYTFVATNSGNVALNPVTLNDPLFGGVIPCGTGALAPAATRTCTATYTLTQADVNSGSRTNTATVSGTPPIGPIVTATATAAVPITQVPALTLDKSASAVMDVDGNGQDAGDRIDYSFLVTNTGTTGLTGITINETAFTGSGTLGPVTCPQDSLAPRETVTCTASYTLTQADVDRGTIDNTATASGIGPGASGTATSTPDSAGVTLARTASLTLVKSASPNTARAFVVGAPVDYTFVVTNTGNTTLTGMSLTETDFTGSGAAPVPSCPSATLAPGAQVTCTAAYTVTQADIDAGGVQNSARATATPPAGLTAPSADSSVSIPAAAAPSISLTKSADPTTTTGGAGTLVTYTFTITNTGNQTVTGATVDEGTFSGTGTLSGVTCVPGAASITPGAQATCIATYRLTQADVDAGTVTNDARASATAPGRVTLQSGTANATVTITPVPSVSLTKTATPSSVTAAGQPVTYTFVVTNTGNTTVSAARVAEGDFSGTGTLTAATCPAGSIAPGESATCTASYTTTQADIDAGTITNSATASAAPPTGPRVASPAANATVDVAAVSSLSIVKSASPNVAAAYVAGQVVTYTFVITNTGDTTETGVGVSERTFTGSGTLSAIDCGAAAASLAPGAQVTCTAAYTLTQADVDAGSVTNTATAIGTGGTAAGGRSPIESAPSSTAVPVDPAPALTLLKTVTPGTFAAAGDTLRYTFRVTNTGNVNVSAVSIDETAFSGTATPPTVTCPAGAVAPGQFIQCTATYDVTQADVDAGSVTNTAIASATPAGGGPAVASPPSTVVANSNAVGALSLTKTATPVDVNRDGLIDAGDRVQWLVTVTNPSTVTVSQIVVSDPTAGTPVCPTTALAPHASMVCVVPDHTITAADAKAGKVSNTVTAAAVGVNSAPVIANPATATVRVETPVTPPPPGGGLAFTGADAVLGSVAAALLLGTGAVFLVIGRRRRRTN